MPEPKNFHLDVKLKTQNSNHTPSLVNLKNIYISLCPHEKNNQVTIIPNVIQFSLPKLQIHKFSWMESLPKITIPTMLGPRPKLILSQADLELRYLPTFVT